MNPTENTTIPAHSRFSFAMFGLGAFLRSLSWLLVVAMIAGWIGQRLWRNRNAEPDGTQVLANIEHTARSSIDWSTVDADLAAALHDAREQARSFADAELGKWVNGMRGRIEKDFLPWYFNYWTQKGIGFRGMRYWIGERRWVQRITGESLSAEERMIDDIQLEFSKRVLRPVIAQREINAMTHAMMAVYIGALQGHMRDIQTRYKIPRHEWNFYLNEMARLATGRDSAAIPLEWKALGTTAGAAGVAATISSVGAVRDATQAVGTQFAGKATATAASKTASAAAAKSGAKVGAKLGGKMLGPIVLAGVILWDVWDHHRSRNANQPILRENLKDYLDLLHQAMLDDPEGGMMPVIHMIENDLAKQLGKRNALP